jgi:hypothetical protein
LLVWRQKQRIKLNIFFSTLGIRIDHKILESIIWLDADVRLISWFSDDWCSTNDYLCNQCISPLTLWVWITLRRGQSRHIFGLYYLSTAGLVHLMSVLHNTHTETNVLLMCINYNGLILVCPHLITPIINQLNKQKRQRVYWP